jgi:hypothetical protein
VRWFFCYFFYCISDASVLIYTHKQIDPSLV